MQTSKLTKSQKKTYSKIISYNGIPAKITTEIRYDDECNNGHNSFAITGHIEYNDGRKRRDNWITGGCIHKEIKKYFPELAKYIKWHFMTSEGPLHYIANTTYLAGNMDYNGKGPGDPSAYETKIQFGDFPILIEKRKDFRNFILNLSQEQKESLEIMPVHHKPDPSHNWKPGYSFTTYPCEWSTTPFDSEIEAEQFLHALIKYPIKEVKFITEYSEGKEREFDAARHSAIWPEATEEILSLPKEELIKKLEERLPKLIKEFIQDLEELNLTF